MIKLFGFNKKEKISIDKLTKLYANTLFEVVDAFQKSLVL